MRARNCRERTVGARDPGYQPAVIEADGEIHSHRDSAGEAGQQPNHARVPSADRHEIRQPDTAVGGFKFAVEDERVIPVAALDTRDLSRRSDPPAAVSRFSEERGKTGGRIKPRNAQPVDRSVAADQ